MKEAKPNKEALKDKGVPPFEINISKKITSTLDSGLDADLPESSEELEPHRFIWSLVWGFLKLLIWFGGIFFLVWIVWGGDRFLEMRLLDGVFSDTTPIHAIDEFVPAVSFDSEGGKSDFWSGLFGGRSKNSVDLAPVSEPRPVVSTPETVLIDMDYLEIDGYHVSINHQAKASFSAVSSDDSLFDRGITELHWASFFLAQPEKKINATTPALRAEQIDLYLENLSRTKGNITNIYGQLQEELSVLEQQKSRYQSELSGLSEKLNTQFKRRVSDDFGTTLEEKSVLSGKLAKIQTHINARKIMLLELKKYPNAIETRAQILKENRSLIEQNLKLVYFGSDPFNQIIKPSELRPVSD